MMPRVVSFRDAELYHLHDRYRFMRSLEHLADGR